MSQTSEDTPSTAQKFAAEILGTFVLVFFGCGAAIGSGLTGGDSAGYIVTGLTFGLTVVVMAYAVGRISGGHFNPAVTLGATLGGRLAWNQAGIYWAAQLLGGLLAGSTLFLILQGFEGFSAEGNMAQNSFGDAGSGIAWWAALLLEALLTLIFCWIILAVTDARNDANAALAPLAIGLSLAMIHFASMFATGTSVNPARSIGVGVFAGTDAIVQLWLFILAPLLGAVIAGLTYPVIFGRGGEPVPGSGLSFGSGRTRTVPVGYPAQWPPGQPPVQAVPPAQPGNWGHPQAPYPGQQPPQQWGAPAPATPPTQPQQWGVPQSDPGHTVQPGPPIQPGPPTQPGPPIQPGAPAQWGNPNEDDDGRTQVRRPD